MSELTGKVLDLDGMRAVLRAGGSVAYNGKGGHRIISHERNLPTVDELVADGYLDAEVASADIDKQMEKLQRSRAKLPKGKAEAEAPKGKSAAEAASDVKEPKAEQAADAKQSSLRP